MANIFLRLASAVRKEPFPIDPRVPSSYMARFTLEKAFDYLRGLLKFRRPSALIFLGRRARRSARG